VRVRDGSELSQPDISKLFEHLRRQFDCQPSLSDSAGPHESAEPAPGKQPLQVGQFRGPPEERRQLQRQIVLADVQRLQRGKISWEPVDLQLVEMLGAGKVLQPVLAEVADADARGKRRGDEPVDAVRNDYLPAVSTGGDACRAVDIETDVIVTDQPSPARVQ